MVLLFHKRAPWHPYSIIFVCIFLRPPSNEYFCGMMRNPDRETISKKKETPERALLKAMKYCAYQERSQQEVRDKLYSFGLHQRQVEDLISQLIIEGFLKEERFAIAYATGKFKIKSWGAVKIRQGLKEKNVSDPLIRLALDQIDAKDYLSTLNKLLQKKGREVHEKNLFKRNYKLAQYCIRQGFEPELVWNLLRGEAVE
jgi:regulatory protein